MIAARSGNFALRLQQSRPGKFTGRRNLRAKPTNRRQLFGIEMGKLPMQVELKGWGCFKI